VTAESEADDGGDGHGGTLPTLASLEASARRILEAAWREDGAGGGYCVPNPTTYPWQWLWDSCFHTVVWAHLGDRRAVAELTSALADQDDDGFVPHLRYGTGPHPHAALWGRPTTSSITQPPMYGHAARVLVQRGMAPPDAVLRRARLGLRFLLHDRRRSPEGLVELCHPWESGCDDSPRWDDTIAGSWTTARWYDAKGELVGTIERSPGGAPLHNPSFAVGSVGFSALVAWNARELAEVTGDATLRLDADALAAAVDARWDADQRTWVDDGPTAAGSGRVRTLDAMLPLLIAPRAEAFDDLLNPGAFGAVYGPTGVHRAEPSFAPDTYWRGPAWPQLTYLLWLAATSSRRPDVRRSLSRSMIAGASVSGFSEYWEPDTAHRLGAAPQSWAALACTMSER
jgi:glucosylglycerate hydrolase